MIKRMDYILGAILLGVMFCWCVGTCDDSARFLTKRPDALRVPWVWVETTRVEAGGEGRAKP